MIFILIKRMFKIKYNLPQIHKYENNILQRVLK